MALNPKNDGFNHCITLVLSNNLYNKNMKSVKTLVTIASIVGSAIASQAQSPTAPLVKMKKAKKTINVAFLIYDQVEVTDLNGPIDVFTKANVVDPHL